MTHVIVSLALILSASLLPGCGTSHCSTSSGKVGVITLSPEQYAEWQAGGPGSDPTGGESTGGTSGGTMLTDEEICPMVCAAEGYTELESCEVGEKDGQGRATFVCHQSSDC